MNTIVPIAQSLKIINSEIASALQACNRQDKVLLVAVSKTQTASTIRSAFLAGQAAFGENYLQEAINKQQELSDLAIDWHFIGPIQSNKTQAVAERFSWVHSVDRLKIAQRLSASRSAHLAPLNICIQINVSNEPSKSGVSMDETLNLALAIKQLPQLNLRGLMAIPAASDDLTTQHAQFKLVRDCYTTLNRQGLKLDTLSIGMSNDFQIAIAQGATIVRIGSAIFGARG